MCVVIRGRSLLVPVSLFLVALLARALTIAWVTFPPTEGSLYYLDVARNLVEGHGLTTNALWSYASPPLTLPRPAFDLWLPLGSIVAAIPMLVGGTSHQVGQVGGALLGACLAPLAWVVAREATRLDGLEARRSGAAAVTAGLLAAVLGPWLVATAAPDLTIPFAVLGTVDALLVATLLRRPTAIGWRRWLPGLCLGISLGATYLARQEVIWIGLTLLILAMPVVRGTAAGARARATVTLMGPVVIGGLLLVVPWLVRQQQAFGGSATAQAVENMFLIRNEQIFSIHDRATLSGWLGQGLGPIVTAPVRAFGSQLVDIVLVGAFPVGIIGLLSVVGLRRRPSFRGPSALVVLLLSGGITFVATVVLFPVATLWGTFAHASGPLLMGFIVATVLGVDAVMTRISTARHWDQVNVIVGPVALLALTIPIALVQVATVADSGATMERRLTAVEGALAADDGDPAAPLMSDHPMSLAWVLKRPVMVLPDDPPTTLAEVADQTGMDTLVVFDDRGRYPGALLHPTGASCLADNPVPVDAADGSTWMFRVDPGCVTP